MRMALATSNNRLVQGWDPDGGRARVFSGHESFAFRYGWLPKLYEAVEDDPELFTSDERAILALGLGRNMVKSIRFWGEVLGLLRVERGGATNTRLARALLDPITGLDPYLENAGSLWRLHWRVAAHAGLGAWTVAFLEVVDPEITRDRLVELVRARAATARSTITAGTAGAHVDIMLRTYDAGRAGDGAGVVEDSLGCLFQEIQLLYIANPNGRPTVRFARGPKPDLDVRAFAYTIHDFWTGTAPSSRTISLRSLMLERRAPGPIFRLDESSLHEHLEALCAAVHGFELREDGAGGLDLVVASLVDIDRLEELAWPTR
jgi:hypothetical protein